MAAICDQRASLLRWLALPERVQERAMSLLRWLALPERVLLAWLIYAVGARRWLTGALGAELVGRAPRWRCAFGLPTQLVVLPLLCYFAFAAEGRDMTRWSDRCSRHGLGANTSAFALVFGAAMLYDFATVEMRSALIVHHIVSVLGHAYACAGRGRVRAALPWYVCGVAALEAGSGACSGYWLLAPCRPALFAFVGLMTASNLAGAACTWRWWRAAQDGAAANAAVLVSVALVAIRQREALRTLLAGIQAPL